MINFFNKTHKYKDLMGVNRSSKTFVSDVIRQEISESDYDPRVVEKQEAQHPVSLPLSYVLRFFTDAARKEFPEVKPKLKPVSQHSGSHGNNHASNKHTSTSVVNHSNSPAGSDADEDEAMTDSDSNDSWTTSEEFSSEFILRYGSRPQLDSRSSSGSGTGSPTNPEKPFACPVPGCKKRYKNVNGIKYHSKNGHKNDGKIRKAFKCHCGKSYKTSQGLKVHTSVHHAGSNLTSLTTQMGEILQIPARDVAAALTPLRTVTLKPLVNASGLNVGSINGTIGLPVKTLQGVVVSTKSADGTTTQLKGSVIEANSFNFAAALTPKVSSTSSSNLSNHSSVPALVASQKASGLFINTLNLAGSQINSVTESSAPSHLGILTPASSPQTPTPPPPLTPEVVMSLSPTATQHIVSLPVTPISPANTPPLTVGVSE